MKICLSLLFHDMVWRTNLFGHYCFDRGLVCRPRVLNFSISSWAWSIDSNYEFLHVQKHD